MLLGNDNLDMEIPSSFLKTTIVTNLNEFFSIGGNLLMLTTKMKMHGHYPSGDTPMPLLLSPPSVVWSPGDKSMIISWETINYAAWCLIT